MFLSLLVWLSVSLILSEAAEWHRGPQTSLKDNGEASSLNGDGRTLGDIIFNVYAKNTSMPSLLERMLADDTGKRAKHVQHEVRGSQPTATRTAQSQSNGSVRKGVPHPFKGPPEAADAAHPQKGIGYAERELDLFHQMFDKYLNFKAHRTGEETHDSRKELKSTCEKLLQREEKRTESGMGGHSSQVGVKPTEADYSHGLSMGDHHQRDITARASQNTSSKETNLFPSFETFVNTMLFPFTGLPHEAPSQEGRDEATIRQEVFKTDLTQRRPEMSPMADANGTLSARPATEPQTEVITFTSTSMQSKVGKPTSTPDYLKDSSPTSVTEPQTEVSISTTETHSDNSTTLTAVSQTVSLFTSTTEKGDVSTPSKGYDLSASSTALQNHDFPTPSKAPQRHSSGVPSRGPQQHGFPTPSEGPQQHGIPSISNRTPLRASLTPSERPQPQQHGSPTPSAGPQQHGSPTPAERPQQHGSPTPAERPQQHGSPTPSAGPQQHGFPTISNGTPLRASLTPSERPQQLGSSTVPVGLQQLRSPVPSKGSYLHGFATHSKGLQKYGSPQPSKGPPQQRSPALSKGLAKHSLPIPAGGPQQHGSPTPAERPQQHGSPTPSAGPQQHGSPTPSKRAQKHGSPGPSQSAAKVQSDNGTAGPPTQSPAGSETSYLLKEHLSSKGNERKSPGNVLTMTKGRRTLRRSLLIQEDEPKGENDEYVLIEFVSTTSPPKGKRQEVARIEETADSSNQPEIPLLEKLMKNLSAQSRRAPSRDDVRNLEAAVERLNAALSEFEEAEAGQEPGRSRTLTSCRRRAGQKEAAEPRRPEPSGQADGAQAEIVLYPEAVFTRGRAEREGEAQPHLSSGRRAPEKEAQEAKRTAGLPPLKRQRQVERMFLRKGPSASDPGVLGDAASRADASQPGDRGAPTRYSPPPNGARSRRTPEPSVKVSSPDTPSREKHSPLPISSSKRHRGPLHDLPLNARGLQAPAPSFIRPPVPAVSTQISRGSPKRASPSLPHLRSGQGASAHSTRRTLSPSSTPKPHILKGSSLSFRRNGRPRANVPAPANRTLPRPGKPLPRSAPATGSTPHTLRSNTHVIRHGSMYSRRNGPKPPIRKRSLPTGPPSPRNYNAPFPLAHRPRQHASSFPSRGDGRASNISDQDLSGNRKPQRGSQGEPRRAPLKRPQASSRSTKPSSGAYPPGTGNRKSFLNYGTQLRNEPRAVSDSHDQRVRASQPPKYRSRANPSYRLNPPPETVRHSDPPHRLRLPSPENMEFSNPSLRLDPPSPENVWLSNSYHRLNPPFPENAPTSHPFHGLNSHSLGNLRASSHSRSSRPSSPENRRTSNLSQSFNPSFPDIQSSHPSSSLSSAGSRKSLNPSQGLRSSSSGNRRQLNHSFNLNPSSSGILRSSESSRRLNPYSTGNMEHSSRRHRNHSRNLNTGYRQSSSPSYNLNPSLTENGRYSSVEGLPDSGEMFPELPQRLSPRPHVKGRLSELFYKFTPPTSARKRSHNPRPSSALDELSEAIPNNTPQAVGREVPRLHLRLSQKAPQKRPSNSQDPSTRTPMLFTDAPSQISITRCIHHVHYLKTPVDRSSALRHPTPAALRDRVPFEESAITFPTERALPNPVTTSPTLRFFQSMPVPTENVAPSSLNAPSLEFPFWRQAPRLHHSRGHRRPVSLSSNPYCDPNPVVPLGASPPPEQILHRVHDLYSPTSQPSPPSVQNRPPLSTSPATTVERSATATASKRQHHRATSAAESAKRKIDHNKTAPLPKKKPSKTYRDKSTPDPVRKKLSKASPNPAPIVPGDYRPLDSPPNKSPSSPLDKKSWSPPLVSNPSEARSQASAADRPANRAPFLAVPNVGRQIAQNHHRAVGPAVGIPSSSTVDLDYRGPLDHLGSRQALPRPGHAVYSPRARNPRLSSSGRPPSDTIPSRLPSRRAYQFIRSIGAGIRSWAFPSGGRAEVAPAPQRAPQTLASRKVSSPPSGPVLGRGSLDEAPRSPANPAAPGKLTASRLGNVPGPKVERTM